jgi:hypothetical protein
MTTMEFIKANANHQGDDCLIWPYARDLERGYGYAWRDGKTVAAHREMCRVAHGDPPFDRACATHSCGKGHLGCVNPKHLAWRTQQANIADKVAHGTHLLGEVCPNAKLTASEVVKIYQDARAPRAIAADYGCTWQNVRSIKSGLTWSHLTGHPKLERRVA